MRAMTLCLLSCLPPSRSASNTALLSTGIFSFNLSAPQVSSPVTLNAFDRLFKDFATDGDLIYVPNVGFPTSNSYYHMNETFTVAYNLSQHSMKKPNLLCMHNFTDPGATTVICDTGAKLSSSLCREFCGIFLRVLTF